MDCKEFFLSDVVGLQIYSKNSLSLPLPVNVRNITQFVDVELGECFLHIVGRGIGRSEEGNTVVADSDTINVKQNFESKGVYSYNIEVTVDEGLDTVHGKSSSLQNCDYHVVVTTADGNKYLLYELPNTFNFSFSGSVSNLTLTISLKSYNSFIAI